MCVHSLLAHTDVVEASDICCRNPDIVRLNSVQLILLCLFRHVPSNVKRSRQCGDLDHELCPHEAPDCSRAVHFQPAYLYCFFAVVLVSCLSAMVNTIRARRPVSCKLMPWR